MEKAWHYSFFSLNDDQQALYCNRQLEVVYGGFDYVSTLFYLISIDNQWWSKPDNISMSWFSQQSAVSQPQTHLPCIKFCENKHKFVLIIRLIINEPKYFFFSLFFGTLSLS